MSDGDAERLELAPGADAGKLEKLRRIDGPAAEDNLAIRQSEKLLPAFRITHADRASSLNDDFCRERLAYDLQIPPLHGRPEISIGGGPAHAVLHRHIEPPEALLPLAVDIRRDGVTGLARRLDKGVVERIGRLAVTGRERALAAAVGIGAVAPAFGAAEVRQDVPVAPALRSFLLPTIEVERVAPHIDHAIDRGRPSEHLAARHMKPAIVQMRLRLALVAPIVFFRIHRNGERGRHLNDRRAVGAAIFKNQDRGPTVFAQPVGENAARRTRADDDIVKTLVVAAVQSLLA